MTVTVADRLVSQLWEQGLRHCFGCLSYQIEPLPQALAQHGMSTLIAATETGAGYMAQGLTLSGRGPGVVFCGGGPGLAMLLPALQAARLDRTPILALVGQTSSDGMPRFQCTDADGSRDRELLQAIGIATRHLSRPEDLIHHLADLREALDCGHPAVLTIPLDILAAPWRHPEARASGEDVLASGASHASVGEQSSPPDRQLPRLPRTTAPPPPAPGSYREAVAALVACLPPSTLWFGDAGQPRHAMTIELAQHGLLCLDSPAGGPMGWAIAAAIGAASGAPDRPVCCFTGDGSTLLLGNEMATAARSGLRITFVLAANGVLGNPHGRLRHTAASTLCELPVVDWCLWGRSLGLSAVAVDHPRQIPDALGNLPDGGPRLLVVPVPARDDQVMPPYSLGEARRG